MRDPKRIDEILKLIDILWKQYPDMRLMQLLINYDIFTYRDTGEMVIEDPFYMEDSEILTKLMGVLNEN